MKMVLPPLPASFVTNSKTNLQVWCLRNDPTGAENFIKITQRENSCLPVCIFNFFERDHGKEGKGRDWGEFIFIRPLPTCLQWSGLGRDVSYSPTQQVQSNVLQQHRCLLASHQQEVVVGSESQESNHGAPVQDTDIPTTGLNTRCSVRILKFFSVFLSNHLSSISPESWPPAETL